MFDLPCPKRFLRLSTALLAMVTYRCMLPPINRRAGKIKHNKTLSGGPCSSFNTVCFFICFVLRFMYWATLALTGPYSKLDYNLNLAASGELVFVSSSCSSQLLNYTIQVRIKKNYTINDEHQHDFFKIQLYIYLNIYNKPNHCLREPDGRHG